MSQTVVRSFLERDLKTLQTRIDEYVARYPAWEITSLSHQHLDGTSVSAMIVMKAVEVEDGAGESPLTDTGGTLV